MSNLINSKNILAALNSIQSELPSLVGINDWIKISDMFNRKLDKLRHSTKDIERQQLSANLIGMLASYTKARERLKAAIFVESKQEELYSSIMGGLVSIAEQMGLKEVSAKFDAEGLQSPSEQVRTIIMKEGFNKVKSIKLKNLSFGFSEISELAAGIFATISKLLGDTHPILMAAGVLLIVRSFYKAMTVEIAEREASVFWGFIQACKKGRTASETAIIKNTNKERVRVGLEPLTTNQVRNALYKLASIKSVKPIRNKRKTWYIIENYTIQGLIPD